MASTFLSDTEDEGVEGTSLVKIRGKKSRKRKLIFLGIVIGIFVLLAIIILSAVSVTIKVQDDNSGDDKGENVIEEPEVVCLDPWIRIQNDCFLFLSDGCPQGCPWSHAVELCKSKGGILAETKDPVLLEDLIESTGNLTYYENITAEYFWLGLRYDKYGQVFVWDSDKETLSKDITDVFWYNNKQEYGGIHVYLRKNNKNQWRLDDEHTFTTFKPICQKQTNSTIISDTAWRLNRSDCHSPWKYNSGKCFKFMTNSCPFGCSWEEGNKVCEDQDAILAEPDFNIAGDEDNDGRKGKNDFKFLKKIADQTEPFSNWWLGITDRDTEGVFKQESNKEVALNIGNFFDKKKKSNTESKNCLYLKKDSKIQHADCNSVVDQKQGGFDPQPLCMKVDKDTV